MLRHLVFADCAAMVNDVRMRTVFTAMAYGIHPFCVTEDRTTLRPGATRFPPMPTAPSSSVDYRWRKAATSNDDW